MRRSVVIAVAACAALALAASARAQPNVVLIVTDDQRWDTLGYMPVVQSELVAKGVTFENAFAVNPVCCPSRASIFTGQWSHTTGVWDVAGEHGGFHRFDDSETLPVWLSAAGYRTALLGKYLNGYQGLEAETYRPPGWSEWFAFTANPNSYFGYGATDGVTPRTFGNDPGDYATDVLAERADAFIRSAGPEPLFLYLAPKAPHIGGPAPYATPAPRHAGAFAGLAAHRPPNWNERSVGDKPEYIRGRERIPATVLDPLRRTQLETLLAVDEMVARVVAALEDTGRLSETLLIFTSDNGFGWGEHRRAHKIVPHEESIRVPLVVRWDELGVVGSSAAFALNVDLAPTIAEAAAIEAPGAEGRSLLPLMSADPPRWRGRFLIEAAMRPRWRVPPYCGFRSDRWKYVQYRTGEEELYDLVADPYELHNRARRNNLTGTLMAYRGLVQQSACRPPGFQPLPQCTRSGTRRDDRIGGTWREDWICAGHGDDRIFVRGDHRDVVRCGRGVDRVQADRYDKLSSCEIRLR